jgi:hypothetical protein
MSSTLTCAVADLAALHGLLHRLQSADLQLIEVHRPVNRFRSASADNDS